MPMRALVIDDEPVTRRLVSAFLQQEGYDVLTAEGGDAGLKLAASDLPDLVVLDVMMPVMDGYEVCRALRREPATAKIPVVMVTASEDPGLTRNAYAAGAQACVPKPVRREALVATVNVLVAGLRPPPG